MGRAEETPAEFSAEGARRGDRFHALLMAVNYAKEKPFVIKALSFFHNS
jgi:hypothetical protein